MGAGCEESCALRQNVSFLVISLDHYYASLQRPHRQPQKEAAALFFSPSSDETPTHPHPLPPNPHPSRECGSVLVDIASVTLSPHILSTPLCVSPRALRATVTRCSLSPSYEARWKTPVSTFMESRKPLRSTTAGQPGDELTRKRKCKQSSEELLPGMCFIKLLPP